MAHDVDPISIKKVKYIIRVPCVRWTKEEFDWIKVIEGFQYEAIGKFLYGWLELKDLRMQLPK